MNFDSVDPLTLILALLYLAWMTLAQPSTL
jgi:hypothetical protein